MPDTMDTGTIANWIPGALHSFAGTLLIGCLQKSASRSGLSDIDLSDRHMAMALSWYGRWY